MNLQTDDFQALTDLEVRAHEARDQAERQKEKDRQVEAVGKALIGMLVARKFLRDQRLGPGTPVIASRPTSEFSGALGGVEHDGVTFTSTFFGAPGFLIAPNEIHSISNLAYLEGGLSRGQSSKALDWKPVDAKNPLLRQLMRWYPIISALGKNEFPIYVVALLLLTIPAALKAIEAEYYLNLKSSPIFSILPLDKNLIEILTFFVIYSISSLVTFTILAYVIKLSKKIFLDKALLFYRELWRQEK